MIRNAWQTQAQNIATNEISSRYDPPNSRQVFVRYPQREKKPKNETLKDHWRVFGLYTLGYSGNMNVQHSLRRQTLTFFSL